MSQITAESHEQVVQMLNEGMSHADIAAMTGYSRSNVTRIRQRYNLPTRPRALDRFEALEDSLALGMTVEQALDDAGWAKAVSAVRAYQRHGRPAPRGLRRAVHTERTSGA